MGPMDIEATLCGFLRDVLERGDIDLIVCGERKGTALLRALMEEVPPPRLKWPWEKVAATHALDQVDWTGTPIRRVLLFDEMVYRGHTLAKHKLAIERRAAPGTEVLTAAFAVSDACDRRHPDFAYYPSVDLETYADLRQRLVAVLQKYGSLLLDSEHIELSVRLDCGVGEFYRELARSAADGHAFSFVSGAGRLNLTINDPDVVEPELFERWLPPGSNTSEIVSKFRILERGGNRFAILPICYPNTRCVPDASWIGSLPRFVRGERLATSTPETIFKLVGLLCSIELMRGAVRALSDLLRKGKATLETPDKAFDHLAAMFPAIDIEGLKAHVRDIVAESRTPASRSGRATEVRQVGPDTLRSMSRSLLLSLVETVDSAATDHRRGRTWGELCGLAMRYGNLADEWATVPDQLIDAALLAPRVEVFNSSAGEPWAVRTFAPDGESVVVERLRRAIAVTGTECSLAS